MLQYHKENKKLKEENKNKIQRFKSEYNFQKTSKNRYIAKIYDESKNFDNNFFMLCLNMTAHFET